MFGGAVVQGVQGRAALCGSGGLFVCLPLYGVNNALGSQGVQQRGSEG